MGGRTRIAALLGILAAAAGCQNEPLDLTRDRSSGFVFLAQGVAPVVVMDAQFEGRVVTDAGGCLRLDAADAATVIWPLGFRLVLSGTDLEIRDATGRTAGRLGGAFRLGGGEVPVLGAGLGLSEADRQLATSRCPGRYWVVGDVLN